MEPEEWGHMGWSGVEGRALKNYLKINKWRNGSERQAEFSLAYLFILQPIHLSSDLFWLSINRTVIIYYIIIIYSNICYI